MKRFERCLNKRCSYPHTWSKEIKIIRDALCKACNSHLAQIYEASPEKYQNLMNAFQAEFDRKINLALSPQVQKKVTN